MNKKIITPMVFSAFISSGFSDESVENELLGLYGSEEMISIASGYEQPVSRAPAVASVITAEDIKKVGAGNINDVLETVPGLHVSAHYQGYNPIYTFRGIYSGFNPQVLMLINGISITNLFLGNRGNAWVNMPIESIKRIEVIRGPGSAIYGADAFSGVINVITKNGKDIQGFEVAAKVGSFNTQGLYLGYGKQWNDSNFSLQLELQNTDGHDGLVYADQQSMLDKITGTNASLTPGNINLQSETADLRLEYNIGEFKVRAGYQGRKKGGIGIGLTQTLDPEGLFESDRFNVDLSYTIPELTDNLAVHITASYLDVSEEAAEDALLYPKGSTGPFLDADLQPQFGVFEDGVIGAPEVFERHTRFNTVFHYTGLESHDVSMGLGYYHGDLYKVNERKNYCTDDASCAYILPFNGVVDVSDTPFVFLREGVSENHFVYIQDAYKLSQDWEITAGVRYDNYSDFGDTVNPRVALVWSTTNDLTTKFLYGQAFRAPAFAETRAINNPAALGNPELEPETLKSYELVMDYNASFAMDFILNMFYYEWQDIIQFVADVNGGTSTAQNAGRQTGYGFEAESQWRVTPELTVRANYTWQQSTNEETNSESAGAPEQQLYVQGLLDVFENGSMSWQTNWVLERNRELLDTRPAIKDYSVSNISYRQKNLWDSFEAAVIVKNIFDVNAREPTPHSFPSAALPDDLPMPGRSIVVELRYEL